MKELIILTGISGAGKSTCMITFEEMGYYCLENCPLPLIEGLMELMVTEEKYSKVAIAVIAHEAEYVIDLVKKYKNIRETTIFLDCSETVLLSRFKLTRHVHPLQRTGLSLAKSIKSEKHMIEVLRNKIDLFLDTSGLNVNEFRKIMFTSFKKDRGMTVSFMSFGFKHGVPSDVDVIFDMRILPNPFYIPELKHLNGNDKEVYDYVIGLEETKVLLSKVVEYIEYYLEESKKEGRAYVNIGIGCSGGQHRSVTVANYLKKHFDQKYDALYNHRDILRGN